MSITWDDAAVWHAVPLPDDDDDLAEGVRGECPWCGEDATFRAMDEEEMMGEPVAEIGDAGWCCVVDGCYPVGSVRQPYLA